MIQETSLKAYHEYDRSTRRELVFDAICHIGPACDQQIQSYLGWPINTITPRRGELVKEGLVTEYERKKGPTGTKVIFWDIVRKEAQLDLLKL